MNYILTALLTLIFAYVTLYGAENETIERLIECGQFEKAGALIETVKSSEDRHYFNSKIYFCTGNYEMAVKEIDTALSLPGKTLKGLENLKAYYKVLAGISGKFEEFQSEHFIFKASGSDVILAGYALECLENIYLAIGNEFNFFPMEKILVEVYPSRNEFSVASTLSMDVLEKSGTVGICKFNRLMILSPQMLALGYMWQDTLAHEYTHFAVNRISEGNCPLWLHEGIARYFDTSWRMREPAYLTQDGENHIARARKQNKLIPFKKMYPSLVFLKDQDEITLAFAEASSAVDFIRRSWKKESLVKLISGFAGARGDMAFKNVLGMPEDKFERKWKEYVKGIRLNESPGALSGIAKYQSMEEDEFIGADQRGQVRLGDKMREIGRPDAAVIHYEKALLSEPANPVILLKLGRARFMLGDIEAAKQNFELAVEKNPNYVTPYQALGEIYLAERRFDKAIDTYTRAIGINPYHAGTHRNLSKCYMEKGDNSKAGMELKITLLLDPSDIGSKLILERMDVGTGAAEHKRQN